MASNSTSSKGNDEKTFKREYSKKLAEALLQKEENENKRINSSRQGYLSLVSIQDINDAYISLCFDDPLVENSSSCSALAVSLLVSSFGYNHEIILKSFDQNILNHVKKLLTKEKSKFALSDRLVSGISQASSRYQNKDSGKTKKTQNETSVSLLMPSQSSALDCYMELAYVAFCVGPLLCCLSATKNEIDSVQSYLGSLVGDCHSVENQLSLIDKMSINERTNLILNSMNESASVNNNNYSFHELDESEEKKKESPIKESQNNHQNDDSSFKEIFAEESDDDDFDYANDGIGDDVNNFQSHEDGCNIMTYTFDPKQLSEKQDLSWAHVESKLQYLLSRLNYSMLSTFDKIKWKKYNVSATLKKLTLTLLQFHGNDKTSSFASFRNLSMSYSIPLSILRDRTLDATHGHDSLDDYIDLISMLMTTEDESSYHSSLSSNEIVNDDVSSIHPTKAVALTAWTSIISSHAQFITSEAKIKIRSALLSLLEEFSSCVQKSRTEISLKRKSLALIDTTTSLQDETLTWIRVCIAIVPMINFICNVNAQSDFNPLDKSLPTQINVKDAQSILQSGFYRDFILLYCDTNNIQDGHENKDYSLKQQSIVREQVLRTLFLLSAQSPTLLGKYISRVQDFTNIIYSDSFWTYNSMDATLWYALFSSTCEDNMGINIRLKGKITLSKSEMICKCLKGTMDLLCKCDKDIKNIENQIGSYDSGSLLDFICFSNTILNLTYLGNAWSTAILSSPSESHKIKESMCSILQNLGKLIDLKTNTSNQSIEIDDKEDRDNVKNNQKTKTQNIMYNAVRKGIKSLLLLLESFGNEKIDSRSDFKQVSSKTD